MVTPFYYISTTQVLKNALEAASISGSLLIGMVAWQKRNLTEEGWFEHAEWAVAAV